MPEAASLADCNKENTTNRLCRSVTDFQRCPVLFSDRPPKERQLLLNPDVDVEGRRETFTTNSRTQLQPSVASGIQAAQTTIIHQCCTSAPSWKLSISSAKAQAERRLVIRVRQLFSKILLADSGYTDDVEDGNDEE